ncbi:hypothetical protein [Nocardia jinanensis]|uniref:Uncharacterized protein n=1 Tax=Nocardia jinanensis TaxID=382504 RepID=A0A917VTX8_9NOCA|nr:hypothetical protein [Nocardia jinanensis]GGL14211.1 hypothetical protein GCM10011588_30930 [Nocardia jinanensis]
MIVEERLPGHPVAAADRGHVVDEVDAPVHTVHGRTAIFGVAAQGGAVEDRRVLSAVRPGNCVPFHPVWPRFIPFDVDLFLFRPSSAKLGSRGGSRPGACWRCCGPFTGEAGRPVAADDAIETGLGDPSGAALPLWTEGSRQRSL